jgi:hypothetical protein
MRHKRGKAIHTVSENSNHYNHYNELIIHFLIYRDICLQIFGLKFIVVI